MKCELKGKTRRIMKSYNEKNVIYLRECQNCGMSVEVTEYPLFAAATGRTVGQRHLRGILPCAVTSDILLAKFISKKI